MVNRLVEREVLVDKLALNFPGTNCNGSLAPKIGHSRVSAIFLKTDSMLGSVRWLQEVDSGKSDFRLLHLTGAVHTDALTTAVHPILGQ